MEMKTPFLKYVRKERAIFARYNHAHPHFKRNIMIDAVISCLLVLVGYGAVYQYAIAAPRDLLVRSGAITLTSEELIKHVKDEQVAAYWLGPIPGYKYSIICKDPREIIVSYIPEGISLNLPDRFNLTIETYDSKLISEEQGMSNVFSDKDDFVAANGTVGTYYSAKPQRMTLAIPGTDKKVEIDYPSTKRIYDLYHDAEHLVLISETQP